MVMKELHWSWEDLMNVPEVMYVSMVRIMGFEAKEREREQKNAGKSRTGLDSKRSNKR